MKLDVGRRLGARRCLKNWHSQISCKTVEPDKKNYFMKYTESLKIVGLGANVGLVRIAGIARYLLVK